MVAISGMGTAPARATIAWFRAAGIDLIPGNGLLPACVPAAFDAWVTALAAFGTLSLRDVLTPALELAVGGFAMYPALREAIVRHEATFRAQWPTTAAIYLPGGRVPDIGERFRQPDWAATMAQPVDAEGPRCAPAPAAAPPCRPPAMSSIAGPSPAPSPASPPRRRCWITPAQPTAG